MNSPEYPDLVWMPPKSWTKADRKSVQVVVIHATDNREGVDTAEGGGRYDQDRTDGTSTHFFHDADSTVQCVRTQDLAHAARTNGNRIGIQHELCGYASQTAGQWADAVSKATLRQAARQVARDCRKWGIPVRKLTATQVAAGVKGICGHVDITNAFPQDRGTHTDPGPNFPWPTFLALVQAEMDGDDMPTAEEIASAVWGANLGKTGPTAAVALQSGYGLLNALLVMAKAEAAEVPPSVQQLVDGVKAGLHASTPEQTAAMLKGILGPDAKAVGQLLAA